MATRDLVEHVQRHSLGAEVTLFIIDMSLYGLGVQRISVGDEGVGAHTVTFDGDDYDAWPVQTSGWERSAEGVQARPTLTIANVSGIFTPLIAANNDLKGCQVTRVRTYSRYLDGGEDPDPTQVLPLDVYVINRLTMLSDEQVQWELASHLDQQDVMLPGRQALRDYCSHTYRVWAGSGFDYTNVTCPYTGTTYLDDTDASVGASADRCGRRLPSCRGRFGTNAELPFRGFPGLSRLRSRS
jgi:lambda family phage minor tail protein L